MQKLYTKGGDRGESELIGGKRLPKDHIIFEVLGTLDELNAHIGLVVRVSTDVFRKELLEIQDTLLCIGGEIAGAKKNLLKSTRSETLEERIDFYQKNTHEDWYTRFLFPGGTEAAAHLDVARTVCRRLERRIVILSRQQDSLELILQYINRLSDYLFALRCYVNSQEGYEEKEFTPTVLSAENSEK